MTKTIITSLICVVASAGSIFYQPLLYFSITISVLIILGAICMTEEDREKSYRSTIHLPLWADVIVYLVIIASFLVADAWITAVIWALLFAIDVKSRGEYSNE